MYTGYMQTWMSICCNYRSRSWIC